MKRILTILVLLSLLALTAGCDIELGHQGENHDHDGDGIEDHAAEDHENEHEDEHEDEHHEEDQ